MLLSELELRGQTVDGRRNTGQAGTAGSKQDGGMGWLLPRAVHARQGWCLVQSSRGTGGRHGYWLHAKDAVHLHVCIPRNVNDIR